MTTGLQPCRSSRHEETKWPAGKLKKKYSCWGTQRQIRWIKRTGNIDWRTNQRSIKIFLRRLKKQKTCRTKRGLEIFNLQVPLFYRTGLRSFWASISYFNCFNCVLFVWHTYHVKNFWWEITVYRKNYPNPFKSEECSLNFWKNTDLTGQIMFSLQISMVGHLTACRQGAIKPSLNIRFRVLNSYAQKLITDEQPIGSIAFTYPVDLVYSHHSLR